MWAV